MKTEPILDGALIRDIAEYLDKNKRDKILFLFGVYTGLRIKDLLALKARDVKDKRSIYVIESKTKNKRKITLHDKLKRELDSFTKDMNGYEYLFKSREGVNKSLSYSRAYSILQEVKEEFGLEQLSCHTMRKTYGANIYEQNGNNLVLAQKALGHKHPFITEMYLGIGEKEVSKANMKLKYY